MGFYWIKTSRFIKLCFPNFVWDVPGKERKVYLTFDDGPTPEVTEWVLDTLASHGIKATFFCIGNNIENHPHIFRKVIDEGHTIGNHTFNHLNGWNTENEPYLNNVEAAENTIVALYPAFKINMLFRPPYGKIKASQSRRLRAQGYSIIMWDVLSADFDQSISPKKCLKNVIDNTRDGSIIIFHDSVKAFENLKYALPLTIEYLKSKGYEFGVIN
jgi:peptidoglycan/xylan/chitin deacetylase (PgdA/CDA1 family)